MTEKPIKYFSEETKLFFLLIENQTNTYEKNPRLILKHILYIKIQASYRQEKRDWQERERERGEERGVRQSI